MACLTHPRTYQDALDFLYSRFDYERLVQGAPPAGTFKLDRMRELLARLGHPHRDLKIVHVAGTKGKGSTSAMLGAALSAAGYRTGVYTSPHLERLEQRIALDGVPCSEEELSSLTASVAPAVDAMDRELPDAISHSGPTFFEITTAMALLHFVRRQCAAVVLEVGLGGRLDSTNICRPLLSVITTISFDHMRQLGNTLEAIAREKAGIIKPGVPVVTGVHQPGPLAEIRAISQAHRSPLYVLGEDFSFRYEGAGRGDRRNAGETGRFGQLSYSEQVAGVPQEMAHLRVGLLGSHQAVNAAVTVASLLRLRQFGWRIDDSALRDGLARVRCPARVEVMGEHPTMIVDVAHNVASIEALLTTLDEYFPADRRWLIFAASKDKDNDGMLRRLLPRFQTVLFTRYLNNPRAEEAEVLAERAQAIAATIPACANLELLVRPDPRAALATRALPLGVMT